MQVRYVHAVLRYLRPESRLWAIGAGVVTAITILLAYITFSGSSLLGADISTYMLPGWGYLHGQGTLYANYFDIKPPLTYAIFVPWMRFFGVSSLSVWVLYLPFLVSIFTFTWLVIRRLVTGPIALLLLTTGSIILIGSGLIDDLFFVTEIVGLTFVLFATWLVMKFDRIWIFYCAAILSTLAGQFKEVFLFAPFAIIVFAIFRQQRLKTILASCAGIISGFLLTLLVLWIFGNQAVVGYREILAFKQEVFPSPSLLEMLTFGNDEFTYVSSNWFPLFFLVPVGIISLSLLIVLRAKREKIKISKMGTQLSVLTLSVMLIVGMLWQGKMPYGHYGITLLIPIILAIAVFCNVAMMPCTQEKPYFRIVICCLLVLGLVPSLSSIKWSGGRTRGIDLHTFFTNIGNLDSPSAQKTTERIKRLTNSGECIHVAYGWSASSIYLYANRPSCSRFIVPPLWTNDQYQKELRRSLIDNPPKVLVIDESVARESSSPTHDKATINSEVFPYDLVAKNCYSQDPELKTIYVSKFHEDSLLSSCLKQQLSSLNLSW